MTHLQKIRAAILKGLKSIEAIVNEYPEIPPPSIRRVLGQGAKKGIFKREGKGIYTLTTTEGEVRAYIQMGKAEEALPQMEADGRKFDMVFLDPAYFSKALIGGNRGIKGYGFVHPIEFDMAMQSVQRMLRNDDSHVYLMLSGAKTAQHAHNRLDMQRYLQGAINSGLQVVAEGTYSKLFQDGKPVTNVRGNEASSERLILLTRNGQVRRGEFDELQMEFQSIRPAVKTSYPTQKNEDFLNQLILQSTFENETCLNTYAGSGIFEQCALFLNRIVYAVEVLETAITDFIIPKIQKFAL